MNVFNILFPDFLQYSVNHVIKSFIISKYFKNISDNPLEINQLAPLNMAQHSGIWTVYDVPGDGNFPSICKR